MASHTPPPWCCCHCATTSPLRHHRYNKYHHLRSNAPSYFYIPPLFVEMLLLLASPAAVPCSGGLPVLRSTVSVWRHPLVVRSRQPSQIKAAAAAAEASDPRRGCLGPSGGSGTNGYVHPSVVKSTNIVWQDCAVGKVERQKLLNQKGCVIWITGLSGSGKSTLARALNWELHSRGYLSYVLDGDNLRHGLNRNLGFNAEDRAENIRRVGEVAKLFADAGVICIASLISPYRSDRAACRSLVPESTFIEVFMDMPLELCESRDPKGLYKLARSGNIEGFTGIDDPYEPPLNCEIVIRPKSGECTTPSAMAEQVVSYLDKNGFMQA